MRTTTTTLIVLVSAALASVAARQNTQPTPRTVKEVMTLMTIPASDAVFNGAAEPPATAEGWASVGAGALMLAESGKLLMTGDFARDKGPWIEMASTLVKEAETAVKAADAREVKALEEVSDRLYVTCKACHDRYMTAQ